MAGITRELVELLHDDGFGRSTVARDREAAPPCNPAAYLVKIRPAPNDPALARRASRGSRKPQHRRPNNSVPAGPSVAPSIRTILRPQDRLLARANEQRRRALDMTHVTTSPSAGWINVCAATRCRGRLRERRTPTKTLPTAENRGAECFHYKIREAMPPRRFKPSPSDSDKYDGTQEPRAWIEDYPQNVIAHKENHDRCHAMASKLYLKDSARAWLRSLPRGRIRTWEDLVDTFVKNFQATYKPSLSGSRS